MIKRFGDRWRGSREPLPSLFDRHPDALAAARHPRGVRTIPIQAVVGTARHPTQNTADFLPLPQLRGRNWEGRWQRLQRGMRQLAVLPPIEVLQVGNEYWVVDGHNRVAAARQIGADDMDADVIELVLPGTTAHGHQGSMPTALVGSEELRQAGEGRFTPSIEVRRIGPSREEIARTAEEAERAQDSEAAEALEPEARDAEPGQ